MIEYKDIIKEIKEERLERKQLEDQKELELKIASDVYVSNMASDLVDRLFKLGYELDIQSDDNKSFRVKFKSVVSRYDYAISITHDQSLGYHIVRFHFPTSLNRTDLEIYYPLIGIALEILRRINEHMGV